MLQNFGPLLRRLREGRHLSRKELADLTGLSRSSIKKYERGEAEPGGYALKILAEYFGVTVDYLLSDDASVAESIDIDNTI